MTTTQTAVDSADVFDAMRKYGGGFISSLSLAWARADSNNHERLMSVFRDEYERFAAMALDDQRRDQES